MRSGLTAASAAGSAATPEGPGVALSLDTLRGLSLPAAARLQVLEELRDAAPDPAARLAVEGELAEARLLCCEEAYGRGAWLEALEHHDALVDLVARLALALPEQAEGFWTRYSDLLAFLTAAAHRAVSQQSEHPPEQPLRAEVCWRLAQRLRLGGELPIRPPQWLAVLEQQLVLDGALFWRELAGAEGAEGAEPAARRKAVELLARLERLLDPAPEWVGLAARELVEAEAAAALAEREPSPERLAGLIGLVELLPAEGERRSGRQAALTRARLTLELLAPELGPLAANPAPAPGPATATAAAPATPVAEERPGRAELVVLEAGAAATPLQLDLGPLLEAELTAIDAALDDFVWHLPRGSRALPAATALPAALERRWREGQRLPAAAFERLAYAAAAWQRRLEERLEPLPPLDWRHGLVVELGATELAVLAPLLARAAALDPALAELRREHHNPEFWRQRQEVPWMERPPALEALRRLHVEEGYYARAHEPLAELEGWGREASLALLEAEPCTDDAGCLGLWLAVAQELAGRQPLPLPPLGAVPEPERLLAELGGLEVVYVGDRAAAVQAAHRAGRCFRGEPFGLRVLDTPASRWPARPAGSFSESLAVLLEAVDGLYRQRPFAVLLADCGAYRLPLLRTAHQRYGVAALSCGRPLADWLGA